MITVMNSNRNVEQVAGSGADGQLWISKSDAERIIGRPAQEEELRSGESGNSISPGQGDDFLRDGEVNIAAFWRRMGRPALCSDSGKVWMLGNSAGDIGAALQSLQAPDFTLPDQQGNLHALSDFRGKKVFLASWASW